MEGAFGKVGVLEMARLERQSRWHAVLAIF